MTTDWFQTVNAVATTSSPPPVAVSQVADTVSDAQGRPGVGVREDFPNGAVQTALLSGGAGGPIGEIAVGRSGLGDGLVAFQQGPIGDESWPDGAGPQLINTGAWLYEALLVDRASPPHPYWPGGAVLLEDGRAPRTVGLLDDLQAEELYPATVTAG